jgi:hypothetical protein
MMDARKFASAIFLLLLFPTLSSAQVLFGVAVSAGTLGIGPQGAVSVTRYSNVQGGFNFFNYTDNFTKDGIDYRGTLKLRSVDLTYDQYFPHTGGLHVSAGALIYNGLSANATASVPPGQTFSLGNTTYFSGASNAVSGTGTVSFRKAAPMILIGFGNLLPRSHRHFGLSFEAGVVFQGSPAAILNLTGTACVISATAGCLDTSNPIVQANVQSEQNKLNRDLHPFSYYPVIQLAFSYKFSR